MSLEQVILKPRDSFTPLSIAYIEVGLKMGGESPRPQQANETSLYLDFKKSAVSSGSNEFHRLRQQELEIRKRLGAFSVSNTLTRTEIYDRDR